MVVAAETTPTTIRVAIKIVATVERVVEKSFFIK
jgi:hypothetical protein